MNRLDDAALNKVLRSIDKDKLRAALDRDVVHYCIRDNSSLLLHIKRVEIPDDYEGDALEYLFFNDDDFYRWIMSYMPSDYTNYWHVDHEYLEVEFTAKGKQLPLNNLHLLPQKVIDRMWKGITTLNYYELNNLFAYRGNISNTLNIYYGADLVQIYPYNDDTEHKSRKLRVKFHVMDETARKIMVNKIIKKEQKRGVRQKRKKPIVYKESIVYEDSDDSSDDSSDE